MTSVNVFKLSFKRANGERGESKNYYFYHNRKKVNTGIQNKRDALAYAEKFLAEQEVKTITKQKQAIKNNPDGTTLLEKLKEDGWIAFDENDKCQYWKNPKYIMAQTSSEVSYGVQQAKQVGSVLKRVFITNNDALGRIAYNKITKTDALAFRERLAKYNDIPNATKNEAMKAVRAIYTFWNYDETITFNPFRKSKSFHDFPKTTQDKRDVFSSAELQTIFNKELMKKLYPKDAEWLEFLESDYYKSYLFCALTGLRSAEARCLIPSQIKDERILTVDRAFKEKNTKKSSIGLPKCDKTRVVLLCDSAYEIIADRLEEDEPNKYIFRNKRGTNAIEASRWNKNFSYFMKQLQAKYPSVFGGKYYTPHCLRKTLNTLLVNKYGCNPNLVIDYLGWGENIVKSNYSKIQKLHYTFTKAEHLIVVAQAIERMYSGREMLWMIMNKENDNATDLELKKMNMLIMAGVGNE
jgi:integrase